MDQPGSNTGAPDSKGHAFEVYSFHLLVPILLRATLWRTTDRACAFCLQPVSSTGLPSCPPLGDSRHGPWHRQGAQEAAMGLGPRTFSAGFALRGPDLAYWGICLTSVTLDVHSRSQRHALGPWAVTAMTIWTL